MNKDGNPFTISTRHVEANVNMQDENQHYQNSTSRRPNAERASSATNQLVYVKEMKNCD
jgi:hypothetical protein